MPSNFKSDDRSLHDLLSTAGSYQLCVPKYQRSYSWKTTHCRDFWRDLLDFSNSAGKTDVYFLGSVILVRDEEAGVDSVLDGQQRLATTTILLASLRDFVNPISDTVAKQLQEWYIRRPQIFDKHERFGIRLSKYDNDFFRALIQTWPAEAPPKEEYESHRLLARAKLFFDEEVKKAAEKIPPKDQAQWAHRLAETLMKQFTVIRVVASDHRNAAKVFQVVNDRGINLSVADLLRVFLLQRCSNPEEEEKIVDRWEQILELDKHISINQFLRYHWVSRQGDAKSRMIDLIEKHIEEEKLSPLAYSDDLVLDAELYRSIVDCKDANERTVGLMRELNALDAELLVPLFISALDHGDPKARNPLLREAIDLYVRYSVITQRDQTKLEALAYATAAALRSSGDFAAARKGLADFPLAPTDDEVQRAFAQLRFAPHERDVARYLLFKIESHLSPPKEKAIRGPEDVEIEHISPRSPNDESRLKRHDEYVDRLGNQTLLFGEFNRRAWRHGFERKRALFQDSHCKITSDLASLKKWDEKAIDRRQSDWAAIAPVIWPAIKR